MKIWLLSKQSYEYETLSFINESDSQVFNENFNGVSLKEKWVPIQVGTYKDGKESDSPPGLLSPPVFSERAVQELGDLLQGKVEILPIFKGSDKYYAINVMNVHDCIDGENSEVKRFRSGLIMKYTRYAFIQELLEGQDIFKIVDHEEKKIRKTSVFVSDKFREKVIESELKGFDFIEVWDSNSQEVKESVGVPTSDKLFTFEEASALAEKENKTLVSADWAIRFDEDKQFQIGQLQEDGSYNWINPIYYPPIFIGMKWRVL